MTGDSGWRVAVGGRRQSVIGYSWCQQDDSHHPLGERLLGIPSART